MDRPAGDFELARIEPPVAAEHAEEGRLARPARAGEEDQLARGDFQVDVCSACPPFYTGTQKLMDTAGRVDRFKKRYAKKDVAAPAAGQASPNAVEGGSVAAGGSSGGEPARGASGSRPERRAREQQVAAGHSATKNTNKKRKKRR